MFACPRYSSGAFAATGSMRRSRLPSNISSLLGITDTMAACISYQRVQRVRCVDACCGPLGSSFVAFALQFIMRQGSLTTFAQKRLFVKAGTSQHGP